VQAKPAGLLGAGACRKLAGFWMGYEGGRLEVGQPFISCAAFSMMLALPEKRALQLRFLLKKRLILITWYNIYLPLTRY
jgi:hypothetical protein